MQKEKEKLAFAGDGINDASVLILNSMRRLK